ncbi:MAG: putative 4-hydroxybenzoate polyprenyltransferase [Candidatus Sumerlaeaceae bacterium]|nr:putative 4-hydroxybenzoate polyprenyltransferase [Candidatus Sumerlaeaceae bacterium]
MRWFLRQTATVLEMIKFQHTVFALPFALIGALLAAGGLPPMRTTVWIVAACVFARTAAMAFNRLVDAPIDARNPRTATRALPSGALSPGFAAGLVVLSCGLFVLSAAMLNTLALTLSPVALAVLLGYSYTKRFTWLSHWVLGLALGLAPAGAWIAVAGGLAAPPLLLCLGVMFWTAGFDLIYACQDRDFDVREGLFSVPARFGVARALWLSSTLHVICVGCFFVAGWSAGAGWIYHLGVAAAAVLLVVEHRLVNPNDLSRIEAAFFTVNSWVGVTLLAFTALDLWAGRG